MVDKQEVDWQALDRKLYQAFDMLEKERMAAIDEEVANSDFPEESTRFKRKMNRVFRERVGGKDIPHPEVDTAYERIRSRIIRFFLVVFVGVIRN